MKRSPKLNYSLCRERGSLQAIRATSTADRQTMTKPRTCNQHRLGLISEADRAFPNPLRYHP